MLKVPTEPEEGPECCSEDEVSSAGEKEQENQFVMLPPPYGDNNDLPTYDEVERIKRDEEDRVRVLHVLCRTCVFVKEFSQDNFRIMMLPIPRY